MEPLFDHLRMGQLKRNSPLGTLLNQRRVLYTVVLLLAFGCRQTENSSTPTFITNASKADIWKPVQYATEGSDFTVGYIQGGGFIDPGSLSHRLLTHGSSGWTKVEFRIGITAVDTMLSETSAEFVSKDIFVKKECPENEAMRLLDELSELGFFELAEEDQLLANCPNAQNGEGVPTYADAGSDLFYIIKENRVRILRYQTFNRIEDCPGMKEWETIEKVKKLFESNWSAGKSRAK